MHARKKSNRHNYSCMVSRSSLVQRTQISLCWIMYSGETQGFPRNVICGSDIMLNELCLRCAWMRSDGSVQCELEVHHSSDSSIKIIHVHFCGMHHAMSDVLYEAWQGNILLMYVSPASCFSCGCAGCFVLIVESWKSRCKFGPN